jgi:hypothetical protein
MDQTSAKYSVIWLFVWEVPLRKKNVRDLCLGWNSLSKVVLVLLLQMQELEHGCLNSGISLYGLQGCFFSGQQWTGVNMEERGEVYIEFRCKAKQ